MKVSSKIFKGIEYIQLNQLPADQRDSLLKTINQKVLIKILIDGKIVSDCIQYRDYEIWFDNIYRPQVAQPSELVLPKKSVLEHSRS